MDSGRVFENRETGRCVTVYFRLFQRGDGEEFCRCIEDFYGGGYPYKEYLSEEFLLEKCAAGEMTVLCGVTIDGEIISTSAVRKDEDFVGSSLLMLRVVKKAYRGMGIGKAQEEYLFGYAEGQKEICSLYADVMTHNSISQGSLARRGFVYCGLRLMLYRNPVMVPGLALPEEGKMSQAVMCRRECDSFGGSLYCPKEHAEEVRRIYRELGVACRLDGASLGRESENVGLGKQIMECQLDWTLRLPVIEKTQMGWKEEKEHCSYIWTIQKIGMDFSNKLSDRMGQIGRQEEETTILCYLNLRDPSAVYGYEILRKAGFFFTGLKPLQAEEEYMLLAFTGAQTIRYEDIHLHEAGEQLLSYIRLHQKSGFTGRRKGLEDN